MGAVVMRAATIPGPVELTWRYTGHLFAGELPVGEYWYVTPRKKWRWTLGIGAELTEDCATEADARAALLAAAERALRGKE